jgi:surface protein
MANMGDKGKFGLITVLFLMIFGMGLVSAVTIDMTSPTDGSYTATDYVEVAYSGSDIGSSCSCVVTINSNVVDSNLACDTFSNGYNTVLVEGSNSVNLYCTDSETGNADITRTVTYDSILPVLSSVFPADGDFVKDGDTLYVSVGEDNIDYTWIYYRIGYGGSSDGEVTCYDNYCEVVTTTLQDTSVYEFQWRAVDLAGNQDSGLWYFTADNSPPVLSSSAVTDGAFYNIDSGAVSIDGTCSDVGVGMQSIVVAVYDENEVDMSYNLIGQSTDTVTATFDIPEEKTYHVVYTCKDNFNHEMDSDPIYFTGDRSPVINYIYPALNEYVSNDFTVIINTTDSNPHYIEMIIWEDYGSNAYAQIVCEDTNYCELPLSDVPMGDYFFDFIVTDYAGNGLGGYSDVFYVDMCAICNETCSPCGGGCTATDLTTMFNGVGDFDNVVGDITGWDTSCITSMDGLFAYSDFNQDISGWDVSNVWNMNMVFMHSSFNQPLDSWDTSGVQKMRYMFYGAYNFNQDLSSWVTSTVNDMEYMFGGATSFDQDISAWDVSAVVDMQGMFEGVTLSVPNYDSLLDGWSGQMVNAVVFDGGNSQYSEGALESRDYLIAVRDWTITDGGITCDVCSEVCSPCGGGCTATSMNGMFEGVQDFTAVGDITGWDTSCITDMTAMFRNSGFNQDISSWNTGNVVDMDYMFYGADSFNQPIGSWDTGSVTDMSFMFYNTPFDQDLSLWDTADVVDMQQMFKFAYNFNQDISSWDTSSVQNMNGMFSYATLFDQDISGWDVSAVTDMSYMFEETQEFNQPIGSWYISSVTDMSGMFSGATAFNMPLYDWNPALVGNMASMFEGASSFNQPIGSWDVSNVQSFNSMFSGATSFDQDLSGWIPVSVNDFSGMFAGVTLSTANYDQLLLGWSSVGVNHGMTFDGGDSQYSFAGLSARDNELIGNYGWTIDDGGLYYNGTAYLRFGDAGDEEYLTDAYNGSVVTSGRAYRIAPELRDDAYCDSSMIGHVYAILYNSSDEPIWSEDADVECGSPYSMGSVEMSDGNYYYTLTGTFAGLDLVANTLYFTVGEILPEMPVANLFDGSTSNFTGLNISQLENFSGLVLEDTTKGIIRWNGVTNVSYANFDAYVVFDDNFLSIDSANLHSSINSPANVTFYNVALNHPIVLKNGKVCKDCSVRKSGDNLTFTVSGFSNYSLMDMNGSGTIGDPYQIVNADGLDAIIQNLSAHYKLMNNLNLSGWIHNSTGMDFNGSFDGQFFNLTDYNNPTGLFNINRGNISRLYLVSWTLHDGQYNDNRGALTNYNYGVLTNIWAKSIDLHNGFGSDIQGILAGSNAGLINQSVVESSYVYCTYYCGAIAGQNHGGNIIDSFATSTIVNAQGGLNGGITSVTNNGYSSVLRTWNNNTVYSSYQPAPISQSFCGYSLYPCGVWNSYYDNQTYGHGQTVDGRSRDDLKLMSNYVNWSFRDVWVFTGGYPVLRAFGFDDANAPVLSNLLSNGTSYSVDNFYTAPLMTELNPDYMSINVTLNGVQYAYAFCNMTTSCNLNATGLVQGNYLVRYIGNDMDNNLVTIDSYVDIVLDHTAPSIQYLSLTELNDSYVDNRNYLQIQASASDPNLKNLTIYFFNSAGVLIKSNTTNATTLYMRVDVSLNDVYSFYAESYDNFGNRNSTEVRFVTFDNGMEGVGLASVTGGVVYNPLSQTITAPSGASIIIDDPYKIVNLEKSSELGFDFQYVDADKNPLSASTYSADIIDSNNTVIKTIIVTQLALAGSYHAEGNFSDMEKAEYKVRINMDGNNYDGVTAKVTAYPQILSLVFDNGDFNLGKTIAIGIFASFIFFLIILAVGQIFK